KRYVRDSEDRLGAWQGLLDQADTLDGLDSGAYIVAVASPHRKHQRVEDDVFRLNSVFLGKQLVGSLPYSQLPLPRDALCLLFVLVDTAHHQRRAETSRDRHDPLEAVLAVLEVD